MPNDPGGSFNNCMGQGMVPFSGIVMCRGASGDITVSGWGLYAGT